MAAMGQGEAFPARRPSGREGWKAGHPGRCENREFRTLVPGAGSVVSRPMRPDRRRARRTARSVVLWEMSAQSYTKTQSGDPKKGGQRAGDESKSIQRLWRFGVD